MSRLIVVALVALALLEASSASSVDLSKTKNVLIEFTNEDVVPKTALKSLVPNVFAAGFIGNLEIGTLHPNQPVFRRNLEFDNPTNTVQSATLTLTVNNGVISYLSLVNNDGSYAVACSDSNTLGSSRGTINIRASPNTKSYITLVAQAVVN